MVIEEVSKIKKRRKKFGISQSELAEKSGFSQSLIARIEKGGVDPKLSTYKKIERAIEELEGENAKKASDLMSSPVIFISPKAKISKASDKMVEDNISQMPVIKQGKQAGGIKESTIIDSTSSSKYEKAGEKNVQEIMEPPFPELNQETSFGEVLSVLKNNQAVLVKERGEVSGIITRADIIDLL